MKHCKVEKSEKGITVTATDKNGKPLAGGGTFVPDESDYKLFKTDKVKDAK